MKAMQEVVLNNTASAPPERATIATKILVAYVFLLFCRILEMLGMFGLERLRLMLLVTASASLVVFITGNVIRAFKTEIGVLLVALTAWMLIAMPFSSWKSESLNQFLNNWLKSLMVFVIVAGLATTVFAFRRVMTGMGWAAAASLLLVLPGAFSATGGSEGRLVGFGTLSNPNEIAFHLWLGISFLVYLITNRKAVKRILLMAIFGFELLLIMKTVSREGLILAAAVAVLTLLRVSAGNKIKLLLTMGALVVIATATLSRDSLERYMTLFTSRINTETAQSAELSSKTRTQKLQESVELTLKHPIFGVGMGVFMPASVELTKAKGGPIDWQVSHNSYTQVSSELGFPGFFLLIAIYVSAYRQLFRIDRRAKAAGREDIRNIAFTLLLALVVLSIHFCFDSMAYLFYLPLLMGLITAFAAAYLPELAPAIAESSAALPVAVGEPEFHPVGAGPQPASIPVQQPRNPYRLGRKRTHAR